MGLRQDIMAAVTPEEVETLYKSGLKYEFVSSRTRRAWSSAVNRRLRELGSQSHITTNTPQPQVNRSKLKNAKNK